MKKRYSLLDIRIKDHDCKIVDQKMDIKKLKKLLPQLEAKFR